MRMGIAARLSLLLVLVGVLAAGLTGLYAYHESRTLLVDAAKQKLLTSTQVLARRITQTREEISRTLRMLVRHPAALAVLETGQAADRAQVATLLRGAMETHPSYLQLRLISAADHGMEQVRLDRHGQALVEVTGEALQEKGHFPYVADALQLPAE
ncbi:MAG: deoxyuridine 5'-triphosphate nucleotidohydrolase, partial [Ideonella sp.]|nr:deoxyuridine 5'-triphosphate nucleotidohydrolase [Ideonella sp.]